MVLGCLCIFSFVFVRVLPFVSVMLTLNLWYVSFSCILVFVVTGGRAAGGNGRRTGAWACGREAGPTRRRAGRGQAAIRKWAAGDWRRAAGGQRVVGCSWQMAASGWARGLTWRNWTSSVFGHPSLRRKCVIIFVWWGELPLQACLHGMLALRACLSC